MHTGTSAGVRRSISPNSASAVWSGDIRNGSLSEGRPADGRQSHCFELRPRRNVFSRRRKQDTSRPLRHVSSCFTNDEPSVFYLSKSSNRPRTHIGLSPPSARCHRRTVPPLPHESMHWRLYNGDVYRASHHGGQILRWGPG